MKKSNSIDIMTNHAIAKFICDEMANVPSKKEVGLSRLNFTKFYGHFFSSSFYAMAEAIGYDEAWDKLSIIDDESYNSPINRRKHSKTKSDAERINRRCKGRKYMRQFQHNDAEERRGNCRHDRRVMNRIGTLGMELPIIN